MTDEPTVTIPLTEVQPWFDNWGSAGPAGGPARQIWQAIRDAMPPPPVAVKWNWPFPGVLAGSVGGDGPRRAMVVAAPSSARAWLLVTKNDGQAWEWHGIDSRDGAIDRGAAWIRGAA